VLGLADAPHVRQGSAGIPELSNQAHLVRNLGPDSMLLAGGGSAAVARAVYELVERYGVRTFCMKTSFPRMRARCTCPTWTSSTALRCRRQFSEPATGPAMWSLAQHQAFTRQIFKLKFNGVLLNLWPHQPFVDIQVRVKVSRRDSGEYEVLQETMSLARIGQNPIGLERR